MKQQFIHSFTLNEQKEKFRLHAMSTGKISVKASYMDGGKKGNKGFWYSYMNPEFTSWFPVWTWLIEHPKGIYLIDGGNIEKVNDPEYFRSSGRFEYWYNNTQFSFEINPGDQIDKLLERAGISLSNIDLGILSHLHFDHMDGFQRIPGLRILLNRKEWEQPYGNLPELYKDWFQAELLDMEEDYFDLFKGRPIGLEDKLWIIETPGHTFGHCSVALELDEFIMFFAIDVSYTETQLVNDFLASANADQELSRDTYRRIKALNKIKPLIYLPSHDWGCIDRIQKFKTLTNN